MIATISYIIAIPPKKSGITKASSFVKFIAVAQNGRVWDPERGKVFSEPSAEKEEVWPVERVGERK